MQNTKNIHRLLIPATRWLGFFVQLIYRSVLVQLFSIIQAKQRAITRNFGVLFAARFSRLVRSGLSICLIILLPAAPLLAQAEGGADFMRSIGRIYVVVAVILAIFIGLGLYLFSIDRNLTKLKEQIDDNEFQKN